MVQGNTHSVSNDTRTPIVVILIIFLYPIGLILTWLWTKWPKWVKIVVSLPLIVAVISIAVAFIFLVILPKNTTTYQPGYINSQNQDKNAEIKDDFQILQKGLTAYKKAKGIYPQSLMQLEEVGYSNTTDNSPYQNPNYIYKSSDTNYTLSTKLEDGSTYSVSP